jgi:uncharacterized protein (DUF427 family)
VLLNYQRRTAETIRVTTSPAPVSVRLGDTLLAESRAALIMHEPGHPPRYYFPRLDVKMKLLEPSQKTSFCPHKGTASYFSLKSTGGQGTNIAWSYVAPRLAVAEISDFIAFYEDTPGIRIG